MQFVSMIILTRIFKYFFAVEFNIYIILILVTIFIKVSAQIVTWADEYLITTDNKHLTKSMVLKKHKLIFYLLKFHLN